MTDYVITEDGDIEEYPECDLGIHCDGCVYEFEHKVPNTPTHCCECGEPLEKVS